MSSINLDFDTISSLTTDVSTLDTKITDSGLNGYGYNVALGLNSLTNPGQYIALNTAIGYNAMNSIVDPSTGRNTVMGGNAFSSGIVGNNSTIIGAYAGSSLLYSSNDTIIGAYAGSSLLNSTNNTIIGVGVNLPNTEMSNQIAIGTGNGISRATFNGTNWIFSSIPPVSVDASGQHGEIAFDASYIYYCIATNTWARTELTSW